MTNKYCTIDDKAAIYEVVAYNKRLNQYFLKATGKGRCEMACGWVRAERIHFKSEAIIERWSEY